MAIGHRIWGCASPQPGAGSLAPSSRRPSPILAGGWRTPERADSLVDEHYVLAAAGLISRSNPETAMALLSSFVAQSLRSRAEKAAQTGSRLRRMTVTGERTEALTATRIAEGVRVGALDPEQVVR